MAQVIVTVDLGYGDSGKGTMIDALARHKDTELIVRYSGGAQAAHNVVTPDNIHHTFSQFGSGTFVPNVKTYLGPNVLIDPHKILVESDLLKNKGVHEPLARLYIDKKAPLITEFNVAINQTREYLRNMDRHGSRGQGIYETRIDTRTLGEDLLVAEDMLDIPKAKQKLISLREKKRVLLFKEFPSLFGSTMHQSAAGVYKLFTDNRFIEETLQIYGVLASQVTITDESVIASALLTNKQVLFEASQGVLIDENVGFLPYVTGSDVTAHEAYELLKKVGYKEKPFTLGIVRSYTTRHGAGPLITEDTELLASKIDEMHNLSNHPWQGKFRFGWFDPIAVKYAIKETGGIDGLAVTCLDQAVALPEYKFALSYTNAARSRIEAIPNQRNVPEPERVSLTQSMEKWVPEYGSCRNSREEILDVIGSTCRHTVVATSEGKTALQKKIDLP